MISQNNKHLRILTPHRSPTKMSEKLLNIRSKKNINLSLLFKCRVNDKRNARNNENFKRG